MPYKDPTAQRDYQRLWAAERRAQAVAGQSCVDCGSTHDLQLDHLDPAQKVSHRIWSWTAARVQAEVAKCVWRCGPCHRERHAVLRRRCGLGGYKRGCRCAKCRAAKAESNRRYLERKRPGRDLHTGTRLCRPLPSYSATGPGRAEPTEVWIGEQAAWDFEAAA